MRWRASNPFLRGEKSFSPSEDGVADGAAVVELVEADILAEGGAEFENLEKLLEKE
jgi:hypothetical protein